MEVSLSLSLIKIRFLAEAYESKDLFQSTTKS